MGKARNGSAHEAALASIVGRRLVVATAFPVRYRVQTGAPVLSRTIKPV